MSTRLGSIYYGYWLIPVAFTAQFVSVGAQNYVFGAFLTPMTEELDWSRTEYTLARTIGLVSFAASGIFIGTHVDREGGKRIMRIGAFVLGAALFAQSYVDTLWQWFVLNGLVLTAGSAMVGNLVVNVTLAKWFVEKRGRAAGFAAMGVSFAGVVLTPMATALVDAAGWRDAWRILGVAAFLVILPLSAAMRRTPEDHGLHPDGKSAEEIAAGAGARAAADLASSLTRGQALRTRAFYLVVVAFGFGGLSIGMMLVQTIPFMTDAGYSRSTAAIMITVASVPAMLVKPIWGYFIDGMDAQRLTIVGFLLTAVSLVVIVYAVDRESLPLTYVGFALMGTGWGGMIPLQEVVWATFFGRLHLGAVRSAAMPIALGMSGSSPLLTSLYFDQVGDYNGAFLFVAFLAVVASGLILLARRPERPGPPPAPVDAREAGPVAATPGG
jgi:sugar phosphate permease